MNNSNLKIHLFDKEERLIEHLEEFPPTIVVSKNDGIYIFANEIHKIHSSIVLAGAGDFLGEIADWFREEINKLIANWGRNVPDIEIEGKKLLKKAFRDNVQFSKFIIYADIACIEIRENKDADKIFRMNPWGKWLKLENGINYISYKNIVRKSDKKEKSAYTQKEIENNIKKEKEEYGIGELASLKNDEELQKLIAKYGYAKCFLSREKYNNKEFNWIYEKL